MLGTRDGAGGARGRDREEERSHAFWETQPVMQFREDPSAAVRLPLHLPFHTSRPRASPVLRANSLLYAALTRDMKAHRMLKAMLQRQEQPEGPIDDARDLPSVRQQPYNLPGGCASRQKQAVLA